MPAMCGPKSPPSRGPCGETTIRLVRFGSPGASAARVVAVETTASGSTAWRKTSSLGSSKSPGCSESKRCDRNDASDVGLKKLGALTRFLITQESIVGPPQSQNLDFGVPIRFDLAQTPSSPRRFHLASSIRNCRRLESKGVYRLSPNL